MFIASADWMRRNLSKRVEVALPIYDPEVHQQLRELLDIQLADNVKARVIEEPQLNAYVQRSGQPVRAQESFRSFLQTL